MTNEYITEQTLSLILPYLLKPIPAPLSRPPRSALRQTDLARATRVSKLFRSIATPILYRDIVTDNLPLLLAHETIEAKAETFFAYTQTLRIEYSDKEIPEPLYAELFDKRNKVAWGLCGRSYPERVAEKQRLCEQEIQNFLTFFQDMFLPVRPTIGGNIFDVLRTIAISSIYGHDPDTWAIITEETQVARQRSKAKTFDGTPLENCPQRWHKFLCGAAVHNMCYRDLEGPLSLRHISSPCCTKGDPKPISHFAASEIASLPCRMGEPARWVFDGASGEDWNPMLRAVGNSMVNFAEPREEMPEGYPIDLDIYCSTASSSPSACTGHSSLFPCEEEVVYKKRATSNIPLPLSRSDQVDKCRQIEKEVHRYVLPAFRRKPFDDLVRWHPSTETPVCEACGSGNWA